MGTFTWETLEPWKPFLGDIYLGTSEFIDIARRYAGVDGYCLPAPAHVPFLLGGGNLYLGTLGTFTWEPWEPLLGNLGKLGTFTWGLGSLYSGTLGSSEPLLGNLGNLYSGTLGTFTREP